MSSISDALKRAQQERERLQGAAARETAADAPASAEPSLASVVLRRRGTPKEEPVSPDHTTLTPPMAEALPQVTPLSDAIRQAPLESAPAAKRQQQLAETIVEDYTSKRKLNLPWSMVVYHERSGAVAEQYRHIRDALMAANTRRDSQSLIITSAIPGEGKTVTVLNLGLSLQEIRANRVLLIDGCLQAERRPTTLTNLLHLQAEAGLAELLAAPISPDAIQGYLKATPWHNLFVLPAGARTSAPAAAELLKSPALPVVLKHLRSNFDWILVDTPAAGLHPDAGLLGAQSDGMLMAVALHHTPHAQVQSTLRRLRSMNLPVKSCILTRA